MGEIINGYLNPTIATTYECNDVLTRQFTSAPVTLEIGSLLHHDVVTYSHHLSRRYYLPLLASG